MMIMIIMRIMILVVIVMMIIVIIIAVIMMAHIRPPDIKTLYRETHTSLALLNVSRGLKKCDTGIATLCSGIKTF